MSNPSRWTLQYLLVACAVLVVGPLFSKLPAAQSFPLTLFGLSGSQTVHLITEAVGLVILCIVSIHIVRTMPEDGQGYSFLKRMISPVTTLLVVITIDKTLRVLGLSLIDGFGTARYAITHTAVLIVAGLWITTTWLLNFTELHQFFAKPAQAARRTTSLTETDGAQQEEADERDRNTSPRHSTPQTGTPSTLGRYRVLKELGRGAMGVVYLGKDPTIHRFVAIKTMRLDETDDPDKLQDVKTRFFREAESTGRLSHPNIVTIFDAGEEGDLGYIAMELLEGTTLKDWSRKPKLLPFDKVISSIATVAEAMDYAHQQGVVHRDIKPANIMVTKTQVIKIMDFGIAKMAMSTKTQPNIVMGTPSYMSPEQIAGKKVDGRSDIFSLAVVMFELLAGRPPFMADNVSALLFAIAQTPHPSLKAFRPDLPPTVKTVLDRALQKDPAQRYRRANEFATALRSCSEGLAA
ncbi:MAG: serine/threonine protein kinase [Nitrospira sp.]|nr:serine/threonine protein kinase [Nitrospira sp.]MDH4302635.1 serine/threonine protein kinase [Nitrospira sp.]MDH5193492.1 serine/threonine protein kinase [Nitrospira sp.]